jgi:hypothetical protein
MCVLKWSYIIRCLGFQFFGGWIKGTSAIATKLIGALQCPFVLSSSDFSFDVHWTSVGPTSYVRQTFVQCPLDIHQTFVRHPLNFRWTSVQHPLDFIYLVFCYHAPCRLTPCRPTPCRPTSYHFFQHPSNFRLTFIWPSFDVLPLPFILVIAPYFQTIHCVRIW